MKKKKKSKVWIYKIFLLTFVISTIFSIFSNSVIENTGILISFMILTLFISIGIVFDIIGIAVTTANPAPFNAMSSRKIKGAKEAVEIINNAEKVANFCNDVIGDIAGIMSGAAVSVIVLSLSRFDLSIYNVSIIGVVLSGLVAGLTVAGKAYGKTIAMKNWKEILQFVSIFFYVLEEKLRIKVFK